MFIKHYTPKYISFFKGEKELERKGFGNKNKKPLKIREKLVVGCYRSRFLVPEARSVLTQVYRVLPWTWRSLPRRDRRKRSRIELGPESTENTAADEASTLLHHKPICNCFNLSLNSLLWKKWWTLLYPVIIIRYLVGRVGNLKGWSRKIVLRRFNCHEFRFLKGSFS